MSDIYSGLSLPDKLYFKIGEVSRIIEVKPYVLRYWETEFKEIKPVRRNSQRLYDRDTVHLIYRIKYLLHDQKLTIAGARKTLGDESAEMFSTGSHKALLREILNELKSVAGEL